MTIESIENEASIRADQLEEKQILGVYDNEISASYDDGWNSGEVSGFEDGFIEGAKWVLEKLEKENEQLKVQIEKMKCCLNCKHFNVQHYLCVYSMGDKKYYCKLRQWELVD